MDKSRKTISLIVANYNNGSFLETFIRSVLDSTRQPDEWIIVDDGSTDESRDILEKFANVPHLKCIYFPKNQGFTSALNAALEMATGDYIARADPDDLLHKDRLQMQYNFMESNPQIDALGSNASYFLADWNQPINNTNFPQNHPDILKMFKKGENALLHATAFVKGEVYKKYRYQPLYPGEDYEFFARMIRDGFQFHNLQESLYYVRVHGQSSTSILKFKQIDQTFDFRDKIFGTHSGIIRRWRYFLHLYAYRRYHLQQASNFRWFWLFLTAITYPEKVILRLLQILKKA